MTSGTPVPRQSRMISVQTAGLGDEVRLAGAGDRASARAGGS